MSFRWPNKDPDETLDYNVDWSRFLGETSTIVSSVWSVKTSYGADKTALADGETLTIATDGAIEDSIQNVSSTNTATVTTINIAGGYDNTEYTFYCRITDSLGSIVERSIKLRVKER